ncbi:MAG: hypothetical protein ABSG26_01085 [Bryobacteraceae bacterium]|jgi:hypothetical protein
MKNEQWDIVDVFSLEEDLTERQTNPRQHAKGPSPFSAAVLIIGFAIAPVGTVILPFSNHTSDVILVVHRAPKPPRSPARPPESVAKPGIDFARARSGESLSLAFDAYFRPPSEAEQEVEPDDSCFF